MGGYLAVPTAPGPHPAIFVIQEIFGVNAHIRDVTDRFARAGYLAVAPEIFIRQHRVLGREPRVLLRRAQRLCRRRRRQAWALTLAILDHWLNAP
jgi:dienelactone hydrolase